MKVLIRAVSRGADSDRFKEGSLVISTAAGWKAIDSDAAVAEKGYTFEKFALSCARAFGACIDMRDDPADKPIPKAFKPSDYHVKAVTKAKERIAMLEKLTTEQADCFALKEWKSACRELQKHIDEMLVQRNRYETMLQKAKAWTPPTAEHEGLKAFMIKQLEETIAFDCQVSDYRKQQAKLKPLTAAEWVEQEMAEAQRDVKYHTEENKQEVERTFGRTKWVQDLRASLTK